MAYKAPNIYYLAFSENNSSDLVLTSENTQELISHLCSWYGCCIFLRSNFFFYNLNIASLIHTFVLKIFIQLLLSVKLKKKNKCNGIQFNLYFKVF